MPAIDVHEIKQISSHRSYHGWPTITRRRNGELLVAVSAGRYGHICPFGQVHLLRSADDGKTWTQRMIVNTALDDRDAGVLETAKGTLVMNWFTSTAWWHYLQVAEEKGEVCGGPADAFFAQCQKIRALLGPEIIKSELGPWVIRSEDGGTKWSKKINPCVGAPHGPIQLADGRLLYVGNVKGSTAGKAGSPYGPSLAVAESRDDARTWRVIAPIPVRKGDLASNYHEPHMVETGDGRLVVHIRNHNEQDKGVILQCESRDGGKSWSEPHATGLLGLPAHLLRLKDGRLLTTYGYRHDPYGNRIAVSNDHGRTWSRPIALSAEAARRDIGYPSSIELPDGTMLSVWYEALPCDATPGRRMAVVRMARWSWGVEPAQATQYQRAKRPARKSRSAAPARTSARKIRRS